MLLVADPTPSKGRHKVGQWGATKMEGPLMSAGVVALNPMGPLWCGQIGFGIRATSLADPEPKTTNNIAKVSVTCFFVFLP
jgi:hypothetical protein